MTITLIYYIIITNIYLYVIKLHV